MCLGIPGQMVATIPCYGDQLVLVDVLGAQRRVNIGLLEDQRLAPGDWVLIHMGFAVERVGATAAAEALAGLEMMGRARTDDPERSAGLR